MWRAAVRGWGILQMGLLLAELLRGGEGGDSGGEVYIYAQSAISAPCCARDAPRGAVAPHGSRS